MHRECHMVNTDISFCCRVLGFWICGIRGACEKGSQWQSALSLLKAAGPGRKPCRKKRLKHSKNDGDITWGTLVSSPSLGPSLQSDLQQLLEGSFHDFLFAVEEASSMGSPLGVLQCQPAQGPLLQTSAGLEGAAEEATRFSANVVVLLLMPCGWWWMDG